MTTTPQFDPAITAQLACPACKSDLRFEPSHLICTSCQREYPIIDGIPVLIPDRREETANS